MSNKHNLVFCNNHPNNQINKSKKKHGKIITKKISTIILRQNEFQAGFEPINP
jgi:hypothetical protein